MLSFRSPLLSLVVAIAVGLLAISVQGSPLEDRRIGQITFPTKETVWVAGEKVSCEWSKEQFTGQYSEDTGKLLLGYREAGDPSLHADDSHLLAKGFKMRSGHIDIQLPKDLPSRDQYILVLVSDSGTVSADFKIVSEADFKTLCDHQRAIAAGVSEANIKAAAKLAVGASVGASVKAAADALGHLAGGLLGVANAGLGLGANVDLGVGAKGKASIGNK